MSGYLIDNKKKIVKREYSAISVIEKYLKRALTDSKCLSLKFITDINISNGLKVFLPLLKQLFDKDLLETFDIILSNNYQINQKEFLIMLENDAVTLEKSDFFLLKLLYKAGKIRIKVNYSQIVKINLFIFNFENKSKVYLGNISLIKDEIEDGYSLLSITPKSNSKEYIHFFNKLWEESDIKINNIHIMNYFQKYSLSDVIYPNARRFISKMLIEYNKEYLVKNISNDYSIIAQYENLSYYSAMEKLDKYGGVILSNTIGFSEIHIASAIIKSYYEVNNNVLIITNRFNKDFWIENFNILGLKEEAINFIYTNELTTLDFKSKNDLYKLIIIDDGKNFLSFESTLKTKNILQILKTNKDAHVLILSKKNLVKSASDLLNLYKILARGNYREYFKEANIESKINMLLKSNNNELIDYLIEILNNFTVKIDIFSLEDYNKGIDFSNKPQITTVKYAYDHDVSLKLFERLISLLVSLNLEYIFLKNNTRNQDELNFIKWKLIKRLDSSLIAFEKAILDLLNKTRNIYQFLDSNFVKKDYSIFNEYIYDVIKKFYLSLNEDTKKLSITNLQKDITTLETLNGIYVQIKYIENRDEKITNLLKIINTENKQTIIFSECNDTINYIKKRFNEYNPNNKVGIILDNNISIDGEMIINENNNYENYRKVIEDFEKGNINTLITGDVIPEEIRLTNCKVLINFDLPNDPTIISYRIRRSYEKINFNKIRVYNFQSDKRVDKEAQFLETVNAGLGHLIAFFGIDFIQWLKDEKDITTYDSLNIAEIILWTKDYKDYLCKKFTDEIKNLLSQPLPYEDKILLMFIREYGITNETLKINSIKLKSSIFLCLKNHNESYYVVYKTNKGLFSYGKILYGNNEIEDFTLSTEEYTNVYEMIKEKSEKNNEGSLEKIIAIIKYIP